MKFLAGFYRGFVRYKSLRVSYSSMVNSSDIDLSLYTYPNTTPVSLLDSQKAFTGLEKKQKLYAHHISRAAQYGGLIVLLQTSPESAEIWVLLQKLYKSQSMESLKTLATTQCDFTDDDYTALLAYSSGLYTNMGNYKGFGDSKFIPAVSKAKLEKLILASDAYKAQTEVVKSLWENVRSRMYSLCERDLQLGLKPNGITKYFSLNCTQEDADRVTKFLQSKKIEAYNNRVFKTSNNTYQIVMASSAKDPYEGFEAETKSSFEGHEFEFVFGDYEGLLDLVAKELLAAKEFGGNCQQSAMMVDYAASFTSGDLNKHKDGSRHWIKDTGPTVESYIGFIETYRDPKGARGEFEGFVAIQEKEMTKKFGQLVEAAETLISTLPWDSAFEKDKFLRPDFTSLDVMTFSGSGIPAGINIPNYDEIRQDEGFKNVSLGNVIKVAYGSDKMNFLSDEDDKLLNKYRTASFEVQVGCHELLGHGSGKLLRKDKNGKFNFDHENLLHPETKEKISTYYEEGEGYDSVFGGLGSAYEECRAECVGLYLSLDPEILKIFGYTGAEAEDVIYVNWLNLLYAATCKALEMYSPKTNSWGQAHSHARYVILHVLLEAGDGLVRVTERVGEDGKPDLLLSLDRSKIKTTGKAAIETFLGKLNVYKSTADIARAKAMFTKYSAVTSDKPTPFKDWRQIILDRKKPRRMMVQANTKVEDGDVSQVVYDESHEGLIKSWVERFPDENVETILIDLAARDRKRNQQ